MKKINIASFLVFIIVFVFVLDVQAQSPQDTLNQYISDLQKNPNDYVLREKIIRLAQTMNPAPVVPEDARRHYVKGRALSEDAKQPSEFADAAEEFRKVLLIAPWWGEAYMLMGIALEAAQQYDDATAALKLSMSASSSEDLKRKTQDEIYKIEAKKEKAAEIKNRESSPEAVAAKKQKEFDEWLKKLDGARYSYSFFDDDSRTTITWEINIVGKTLVQRTNAFARREWMEYYKHEIQAREIPGSNTVGCVQTFKISEDGYSIVENTICNNSQFNSTRTFNRK